LEVEMKKLLLSAVVALALVAGVFANGQAAAPAAAGPVQLKVQINRDTPENAYRIAASMERIKRFEAKYPNVKVTPVNVEYDNTGEFFVKQAAGQAPDVLTVWATEAALFVSKKWAVPLDAYINAWEKKAWYNPDSFLPFSVDGKIYGIPENNYVKHVIYNKALFKAAGVKEPSLTWTWDDFVKAAVATTDKAKGIAGFAIMGKGGESGWGFTDFIYQAGGEVEAMKDGKWVATFDSPEAVAAAQLLYDLKWKYDVLPANWANGWGDVYNVFGACQAAMVLDADWGRNIAINSLKMDPADIGVAIMPKGPGAKGRSAGVLGGTYWVINAATAKTKAVQDAAFAWIDFERYDEAGLAGIESEIKDARANGQFRAQFTYSPLVPTAPYVAKEKAIIAANPDAAIAWGDAAFLTALPKTAHIEPPAAAQDLYGNYLANVVQTIFSDKTTDVAKLMKETNAKFQKEILDPLNAAK
jgi:ABC-type glycerol-3-phosphate transport system substrate-binding protein